MWWCCWANIHCYAVVSNPLVITAAVAHTRIEELQYVVVLWRPFQDCIMRSNSCFCSQDCECVCRHAVWASGGVMWLGSRCWPGVAAMMNHCAIDISHLGQEVWNLAAKESVALGALSGNNLWRHCGLRRPVCAVVNCRFYEWVSAIINYHNHRLWEPSIIL
jgi:hypothetical protein